jgi:hypothetical protein
VTASNGWRFGELSTIDGCGEVDIATRRSDGTLRAARIVWIVRHPAGEDSGLNDALDAAYRGKYGRSSGAVAHITADVARATTPPEPFTHDHLNDEKDTTWTRTPAAPR